MNTQNTAKKVWFVTGASKGFGLALVKLLLSNGNKVVATSRNASEIERKINGNQERLLALTVDLTNEVSVKKAIDETIKVFERIDVVVNNAGYMLLGSLEEVSDQEFRQSMEVNVFGMVNVIRVSMPYLRKQRSGHIINFSSVAGYFGNGSAGSYNAVKFAVLGVSEALASEVEPFDIKVTVIAPGFFRTSFLEKDSFLVAKNMIEDYHTENRVAQMHQANGNQPGDPDKLVRILTDIVEEKNPPLHLLMGPDAYQLVREKRKADENEFENWKHLTLSTNIEAHP